MENRKFVIFSAIFLAAIGLPLFSYAYSKSTTHPALTDEIIDFFNSSYPDMSLSAEEKELIIRGSTEEDLPEMRVVNHFYDPVRNVGLKTFGGLAAKNWAENTRAQAGFSNLAGIGFVRGLFSAESDYSWERAIYEYAHGDRSRALEGLGHILHLIEDMTVPPHVRDDAHPPAFDFGSPYEKWTSRFTPENIDISMVLALSGEKPVIFPSLGDYFDAVAKFTNENFFSKDTIFDKKYSLPSLANKKTEIIKSIKYLLSSKDFLLVAFEQERNRQTGDIQTTYFIDDDNDLILTGYWNILSKQAVLNGAGVVKLFFDEVEKERETLALYEKNKSFLARARENIAGVFGANAGSDGVDESMRSAPITSGEDTQKIRELASVAVVLEENLSLLERAVAMAEARTSAQNTASENDTTVSGASEISGMTDDGVTAQPSQDNAGAGSGGANDGFAWTPKATTPYPGFGGGGGGSGAVSERSVSEPESEPEPAPEPEPEPVEEPMPEDIEPPDAPALSVAECDESLSSDPDICLVAATRLSANWTRPTDTAYFLLTINNIAATTTATSTDISVSDGETTVVSVAAYDEHGNASAAATKTIETNTMPLVINEIAWMGTDASVADEWIELKNRTNAPISFNSGRWIVRAHDNVPYFPLSGTVSAGGYYLIERTDDNTVRDIPAGLVAPFSGSGSGSGLSNSGETLFLEYASAGGTTTIDRTPDCGNWCYGNPSRKRTMERYDENLSGEAATNWGTALGEFIVNGSDTNGVPIAGTPGARNSISYQITNGTTLSADTTLTKENSPYIIARGGLTVAAGATFLLEAGTVVKFVHLDSPSLVIHGTLIAEGTEEEPVVFTSFLDDAYGGDMNGDGVCEPENASSTASCPAPGAWGRIELRGAAGASSLSHTHIRYGGSWTVGVPGTYRAAIVDDGTGSSFDATTVEYSGGFGLSLISSDGTVQNSMFRHNKKDGESAGIFVAGGASIIRDSHFVGNTYGIRISGSSGHISDNAFTDNVTAIRADGLPGTFSGNTGSGNTTNAIHLADAIAAPGGTTTLSANGLPYLIVLADAHVPAGAGVSLLPGTTVKFNSNRLVVFGHLDMAGGESTPVVMTSASDDTDENDATGNGASIGSVGGHQGIVLVAGSSSHIENAEFRFMETAVKYFNSPISLTNVLFANNTLAVSADAATLTRPITVSNITFQDNIGTTSPSGLW